MIETFVQMSTPTVYAEDGTNIGNPITGIDEVNNLMEGAIAFFNMDGGLITSALNPPAGEYIMVAVGRAEGTARVSTLLSREVFNFVDAITPAAATVKSMVLGQDTAGTVAASLNTPVAIVAGDIVGIIIEETEKNVNDNTRTHRFEYVCADGDTDTQIIADLVAQVNADPAMDDIVVATGIAGDVGISFTGQTVGLNFQVRGYGLYENATWVEWSEVNGVDYGTINGVYDANVLEVVGETEMATKGVGIATQVAELERLAMENRGNTASAPGAIKVATYTSMVEAASLYEVYPCTFINDRTSHATRASLPFIQNMNICVESTSGALAEIDAILQLI